MLSSPSLLFPSSKLLLLTVLTVIIKHSSIYLNRCDEGITVQTLNMYNGCNTTTHFTPFYLHFLYSIFMFKKINSKQNVFGKKLFIVVVIVYSPTRKYFLSVKTVFQINYGTQTMSYHISCLEAPIIGYVFSKCKLSIYLRNIIDNLPV